jgi:hypothetical protein
MKRLCLIGLVLVITLMGAGLATSQNDENGQHPLLNLLSLVPDNEQAHTGAGWATIRYADFQALYISEDLETMRLRLNPNMLLNLAPLPAMMTRFQAGPQSMPFLLMGIQQMPDMVGFRWISDVNQSLEYGTPRNVATILAGSFDAEAVNRALEVRGFESTDVNGITVWHRFEDGEWDLEAREPADPFGGHLGMAARIAILPGYLANAGYWEMTEDMVAASSGEHPSLADDPDYRALAEAITDPDGLLIQALFFNLADVGSVDEDALAEVYDAVQNLAGDYSPLMPYALAVLADRQEDNDQVHLIGLVYSDAAQAAAAAEEMASRISSFVAPGTDEVAALQFNAQISAWVYDSETTGQAVAVVEARYPFPDERTDPETQFFNPGGLLYRAWVDALRQRGFYPLVVDLE